MSCTVPPIHNHCKFLLSTSKTFIYHTLFEQNEPLRMRITHRSLRRDRRGYTRLRFRRRTMKQSPYGNSVASAFTSSTTVCELRKHGIDQAPGTACQILAIFWNTAGRWSS